MSAEKNKYRSAVSDDEMEVYKRDWSGIPEKEVDWLSKTYAHLSLTSVTTTRNELYDSVTYIVALLGENSLHTGTAASYCSPVD